MAAVGALGSDLPGVPARSGPMAGSDRSFIPPLGRQGRRQRYRQAPRQARIYQYFLPADDDPRFRSPPPSTGDRRSRATRPPYFSPGFGLSPPVSGGLGRLRALDPGRGRKGPDPSSRDGVSCRSPGEDFASAQGGGRPLHRGRASGSVSRPGLARGSRDRNRPIQGSFGSCPRERDRGGMARR